MGFLGAPKKHIQIGSVILMGLFVTLPIVFFVPKGEFLSSDIVINEVCCHNESVIYSEKGRYVDYVELYNESDKTINLADYRLSDGKYVYDIPSVDVEAGTYEVIFLDPEITDLQLTDQESIYVCDRYGNTIDGVNIPVIEINKSYAKNTESSRWESNCMPTPWESNEYVIEESKYLQGEEYIPQLSVKSGFYEEEFVLEINAPVGYDIYYTVDGTEPSVDAALYKEPILIKDASVNPNIYSVVEEMYTWDEKGDMPKDLVDKCSIVRAVAVSKDGYVSDEAIGSYFVGFQNKKGYNKTYTLSLVTNPENLFSDEHGIFVGGNLLENNPIKDESRPYKAIANYSREGEGWHREAYVELFDSSGVKLYSQMIEIGIHGNYTNAYPQKGLNLYAETPKNSSGYIFNGLFGGKNKSLMLRPGGATDCWETQFRDALNHKLVEERNLTTLQAVPCQVFIDGEYWGLYNLQERIDKGLIAKKYGIDEEAVIVCKIKEVVDGADEYFQLYDDVVAYAVNNDLSKEEHYQEISNMMDIQSYIDNFCFQIYVAACDTITNNVSYWRTKTISTQDYYDGKWRWIIYDTDDSLGVLEEYSRYDVNSFSSGHMFVTPLEDPLFTSLMKNNEFKNRFVETFYQMENEVFEPSHVNELIDELTDEYMDAAVLSHKRWHEGEYSEGDYLEYVSVVKEFFNKRRMYIEQYMKEDLDLE